MKAWGGARPTLPTVSSASIRRRGTVTGEEEGVGRSPADPPHVFERFYQGKGSPEGFGLGLPICKELTQRMDGSISIRSQEGIGTAVEVELPEADLDGQDTDSRG